MQMDSKFNLRFEILKKEADDLLLLLEKNPKMSDSEYNKIKAKLTITKAKLLNEIKLVDLQLKFTKA